MVRMKHIATLSFLFGAASFFMEAIAENMKVRGKDVIICNYSKASYHYVVLGFWSLVFLLVSAVVGFASLSYAYSKRAIPSSALSASSTMKAFFYITLLWTTLGGTFILWPTLTEFDAPDTQRSQEPGL